MTAKVIASLAEDGVLKFEQRIAKLKERIVERGSAIAEGHERHRVAPKQHVIRGHPARRYSGIPQVSDASGTHCAIVR